MKGRIGKSGNLEILRRGKWTEQSCCNDNEAWCGHYCPLFWESDELPLVLDCSDGKRGISIVSDEREQGPEKG